MNLAGGKRGHWPAYAVSRFAGRFGPGRSSDWTRSLTVADPRRARHDPWPCQSEHCNWRGAGSLRGYATADPETVHAEVQIVHRSVQTPRSIPEHCSPRVRRRTPFVNRETNTVLRMKQEQTGDSWVTIRVAHGHPGTASHMERAEKGCRGRFPHHETATSRRRSCEKAYTAASSSVRPTTAPTAAPEASRHSAL